MSVLIEFFQFMRARKKYWLYPIVIVLVLLGVMVVFAQGSAITPFIYAIF